MKFQETLEDKRKNFAVAIHADRFIIISGGVRDGEYLDSVLKYNLHTHELTNM